MKPSGLLARFQSCNSDACTMFYSRPRLGCFRARGLQSIPFTKANFSRTAFVSSRKKSKSHVRQSSPLSSEREVMMTSLSGQDPREPVDRYSALNPGDGIEEVTGIEFLTVGDEVCSERGGDRPASWVQEEDNLGDKPNSVAVQWLKHGRTALLEFSPREIALEVQQLIRDGKYTILGQTFACSARILKYQEGAVSSQERKYGDGTKWPSKMQPVTSVESPKLWLKCWIPAHAKREDIEAAMLHERHKPQHVEIDTSDRNLGCTTTEALTAIRRGLGKFGPLAECSDTLAGNSYMVETTATFINKADAEHAAGQHSFGIASPKPGTKANVQVQVRRIYSRKCTIPFDVYDVLRDRFSAEKFRRSSNGLRIRFCGEHDKQGGVIEIDGYWQDRDAVDDLRQSLVDMFQVNVVRIGDVPLWCSAFLEEGYAHHILKKAGERLRLVFQVDATQQCIHCYGSPEKLRRATTSIQDYIAAERSKWELTESSAKPEQRVQPKPNDYPLMNFERRGTQGSIRKAWNKR